MSIQYISCKYDERTIIVTNSVNKHNVCQCYSVPLLLLIYPMSLSEEFL